MKKLYFTFTILFISASIFGQVFISEIHYLDSSGTPSANEGVEISGIAGSLADYEIHFYDGVPPNKTYDFISLTGYSIDDEGSGIGAVWIPYSDIHDPSGIALYNTATSTVIEFISFGGSFSGTLGVAGSINTVDILVIETTATNVGTSIQKTDTGWVSGIANTNGTLNSNLTLSVVLNNIENFSLYPNPTNNKTFSIQSANNTLKTVEIYSMLGNMVFTKLVRNNESISVSNLSKGIYLLRVDEEGKIATRKLVVK